MCNQKDIADFHFEAVPSCLVPRDFCSLTARDNVFEAPPTFWCLWCWVTVDTSFSRMFSSRFSSRFSGYHPKKCFRKSWRSYQHLAPTRRFTLRHNFRVPFGTAFSRHPMRCVFAFAPFPFTSLSFHRHLAFLPLISTVFFLYHSWFVWFFTNLRTISASFSRRLFHFRQFSRIRADCCRFSPVKKSWVFFGMSQILMDFDESDAEIAIF